MGEVQRERLGEGPVELPKDVNTTQTTQLGQKVSAELESNNPPSPSQVQPPSAESTPDSPLKALANTIMKKLIVIATFLKISPQKRESSESRDAVVANFVQAAIATKKKFPGGGDVPSTTSTAAQSTTTKTPQAAFKENFPDIASEDKKLTVGLVAKDTLPSYIKKIDDDTHYILQTTKSTETYNLKILRTKGDKARTEVYTCSVTQAGYLQVHFAQTVIATLKNADELHNFIKTNIPK